jgi:NADPH2:quinone reductase
LGIGESCSWRCGATLGPGTYFHPLAPSTRAHANGKIAKYLGANVIGTVSTKAKAKEAKDAGADHVLLTSLSSKETIAEVVRLADGKGVHGVYDGVGKDTWEENFELVRPKATIVTYGNSSGAVPAFEPLKLMPKCLKITRPTLAPFVSAPEDFADYSNFLFKLVQDGALKVGFPPLAV